MRWITTLGLMLLCLLATSTSWAARPDVEKHLSEGRLLDCSVALQQHLEEMPGDDQARFSLGVTQFLMAYEHVGQSLYRYGLRTERSFVRPNPQIRAIWPQNPAPEKIDYVAARKIVLTFVEDMNRAQATLAMVTDKELKFPLDVAKIKIDLFGLKRPVNGAFLFEQWNGRAPAVDTLEIAFDRGDVCWLRGYCHFLAAIGEVLLAIDSQPLFECTAHWVFEKVDTPHTFLLEDREPLDVDGPFWWDRRRLSDIIATIHLVLRFPIKEPLRMQAAHGHLLSMCQMSREMWSHYDAETDDDREWIPSPKQTGVLGIPVTADMMRTWLTAVDEVELVLQGERLVPFWRGTDKERGINVKRAFLEAKEIDIILWVQGTAATPYLEKGPLTKFVEPEMIEQLNRQFNGLNLIGFGFWFN
ncbi:conserved hypothetical protein [Pirellula staleyi DSM 6068]|uniref:Uncharacterized protein n=1 Tax=Pirellula staleyi (strain ATCC 27377 / DSM 6068 / ICPB 4128) TaxID=530564 RepID=D2QX23_PIRSD|nr:hypothetical protein [Pirellula staleyi]ADB16127.1 conserved hypothetical protein [Pirellula staleyi DSM 6068]